MLLGGAFLLWGLHHLDYPLLRARGAWNPWGYYSTSSSRWRSGSAWSSWCSRIPTGDSALAALSGDLQRTDGGADVLGGLLARPLGLTASAVA
jgi:hypothetical protein